MPSATKKNRNKQLQNIKNKASEKQKFFIAQTKKKFPGQLIRLYATTLKNDFPSQILKEFDPKEYLRQKQKLKAHANLATRKYNKPKHNPKRGPGSRGSLLKNANESIANWLERMEKE